jgi:hypothetical protein
MAKGIFGEELEPATREAIGAKDEPEADEPEASEPDEELEAAMKLLEDGEVFERGDLAELPRTRLLRAADKQRERLKKDREKKANTREKITAIEKDSAERDARLEEAHRMARIGYEAQLAHEIRPLLPVGFKGDISAVVALAQKMRDVEPDDRTRLEDAIAKVHRDSQRRTVESEPEQEQAPQRNVARGTPSATGRASYRRAEETHDEWLERFERADRGNASPQELERLLAQQPANEVRFNLRTY